MISRRNVLSAVITGGVIGSALSALQGLGQAARTEDPPANHKETGGPRGDRVQFVGAKPDQGFNYPYYLARPAEVRSGQVPLLMEMNNADEELTFEETKLGRSKPQVTETARQGAWLSEELGVPHLKPVFIEPNGDPVDASHQTALLDRETMLLDETDLERIDRQLLRMADHAKTEILTDLSMRDGLLFYGNSSEGVVSERMAAMHPERVISATGSGLNGFVLLPFEELGGHTLNYPVGVADFEEIIGKPYDRDAHDTVDMFYIEGGKDPKNRLKMDKDRTAVGEGAQLWNDVQLYNTARAVYGRDKVEDRFPRCHIAFEKAGIDVQFRVYPEMTHDPRPASHDLRDFFEKSLAGEDVSEFGQRLELPLDRHPTVVNQEYAQPGYSVAFTVSGAYPPPEGLVMYNWDFDGSGTASGQSVEHTFDEPGTYEITLSMETAHGQQASTSIQHTIYNIVDSTVSTSEALPGEPVTLSATIKNPTEESKTIDIALLRTDQPERTTIKIQEITLGPGNEQTVSMDHVFTTPGSYALAVEGAVIHNPITVKDPEGGFTVRWDYTPDEPQVGQTVEFKATVIFHDVKTDEVGVQLLIDGDPIDDQVVEGSEYSTETIRFEYEFIRPGEHRLGMKDSVNYGEQPIGKINVSAEPSPTPSPTATRASPTANTQTQEDQSTASPDETTAQTPGFGILSTVVGLGSSVGYLLSRNNTNE